MRVHIWQTKCWEIYPHLNGNFTDSLLWLLIFLSYCKSSKFGRPGLGTSIPLSNGNFTDSCSDCSYFLPTLRAQNLADQVLADLPPFKGAVSHIPALLWEFIFGRPSVGKSTPLQMAILQIPALTAHISFLLWELNIWQTRSGHIYPSFKWHFHRFLLWLLIFLSYTQSLTFGRPGLDRSTPLQMAFSQIPVLLWELNIWQAMVLSDLPLFQMAISQIPALTAHISFLLWEFNIWQTRVLGNLPQFKWQFNRFMPCSGTAHISFLRSWKSYNHLANGQVFSRFLLPLFKFYSYSGAQQIGRLALEHAPFKWQFHRFLLYCEGSYLADEVLTHLPSISNGNFTDSCSDYS